MECLPVYYGGVASIAASLGVLPHWHERESVCLECVNQVCVQGLISTVLRPLWNQVEPQKTDSVFLSFAPDKELIVISSRNILVSLFLGL